MGYKNKKKRGGGKPNQSVQKEEQAADGTGSISSTSTAGVMFMVQADTQQQGGQSTAASADAGDAANIAGTSLEAASDALAQLVIIHQGGISAATCKPQPRQQGSDVQAHANQSADAIARKNALEAMQLVTQMKNSTSSSMQLCLLQQICFMAAFCEERKAALLAAGVLPAILPAAESTNGKVYRQFCEAYRLLAPPSTPSKPSFTRAETTSLIQQMVSLACSRSEKIQYVALMWLSHLITFGSKARQCMVDAGAIRAVTEALHRGLQRARLCAAAVYMGLVTVGCLDRDAALAAVVPVAMTGLQCGEPEEEVYAACLLKTWALNNKEVSNMAVAQEAIPVTVQLLGSPRPKTQQAAAALLTSLVSQGGGAQAAVEKGAVQAIVRLLRSSIGETRFFAAEALQAMMTECSQAVGIAVAAGAIKPLLGMLAGKKLGTEDLHLSQKTGEEGATEGPSVKFDHVLLYAAPIDPHHLQIAALNCLLSITTASGTQWHTAMVQAGVIAALGIASCTQCPAAMVQAGAMAALVTASSTQWHMVEAGAVAALITAMHYPHSLVFMPARRLFRSLLVDVGVRRAVAAQLVSLMRQKRHSLRQLAAVATVHSTSDDSFRSVLQAAGAIEALIPLLSVETDPRLVGVAACSIIKFVPVYHREVIKAGAIPLLAVQMRLTSSAQVTVAAVLLELGQIPSTHDQLAQVVPELLLAMLDEDTEVQQVVGCVLQHLVAVQNASVVRALHAASDQWHCLLSPGRNEAQRYTAGFIQFMFMQGHRCSRDTFAFFRSIRRIVPGKPITEWPPAIN